MQQSISSPWSGKENMEYLLFEFWYEGKCGLDKCHVDQYSIVGWLAAVKLIACSPPFRLPALIRYHCYVMQMESKING